MQQVVKSHLERRKLFLIHERPILNHTSEKDCVISSYKVHLQTELAISCDSTIHKYIHKNTKK